MKSKKYYVDHARSGDNIVMVAMIYKCNKDEYVFTMDHMDYRTRKISIIEKIKNRIILYLGGTLKYFYTRESMYNI